VTPPSEALKAKLGSASLDGSAGVESKETLGAAVSTVHV
jgi:hypothetical protein